jgi:hypothetical protein
MMADDVSGLRNAREGCRRLGLAFFSTFLEAKTETCSLSLVMTDRIRHHKKCEGRAQRTVLATLLAAVFGVVVCGKKPLKQLTRSRKRTRIESNDDQYRLAIVKRSQMPFVALNEGELAERELELRERRERRGPGPKSVGKPVVGGGRWTLVGNEKG